MQFKTKDDWLRARLKYVTATQVSALMGENPYKGIKQLAQEKLSGSAPIPDNPYMFWGRWLETPVGKAFAELYGGEASMGQEFVTAGVIGATLDGRWSRGREGYMPKWVTWKTPEPTAPSTPLEIKVSSALGKRKTLPDHYWWQVQTQMHVTGLTEGVLVAMVSTSEMRAWCIEYDAFAMEQASIKAEHFMNNLESYL